MSSFTTERSFPIPRASSLPATTTRPAAWSRYARTRPSTRRALGEMFRQIIANNRAGGWRKIKREAQMDTSGRWGW